MRGLENRDLRLICTIYFIVLCKPFIHIHLSSQLYSVAEVLDILPSLHPELEGLVNNIILTEMKKIPSPDDDLKDEKVFS